MVTLRPFVVTFPFSSGQSSRKRKTALEGRKGGIMQCGGDRRNGHSVEATVVKAVVLQNESRPVPPGF